MPAKYLPNVNSLLMDIVSTLPVSTSNGFFQKLQSRF